MRLTAWVGFIILSTTVACSERLRDHGYAPLPSDLADIVVGLDTKESIEEKLGSASVTALRRDNRIYYVESTIRHYGAREPKVIRRDIVAFSFEPTGVLRNIERFDLSSGRVVPLERRVTETIEDHGGFLASLAENAGRIDLGDFIESE